ncbi:MAG: TetR family transcriptional regulator [Pseudomonadales bacterium]|nr:TetR family transcriptional regulator [Pseudomonadales bacterium]
MSSSKHSASDQIAKNPRSRTDRKAATRHRILSAALQLVDEGRSPGELGLREVARAAGMAAPSIYNHFADMDELGLALVDESLARLRSVARAARKEMANDDLTVALQVLLQQFLSYVNEYESVLRLLIMQWFNPNPEFRKTIRREMSIMRQDLAENMQVSALTKGMRSASFEAESDAIFSLLITFILNALDLSKAKREARLTLVEKQVMMIVLGGRTLKQEGS